MRNINDTVDFITITAVKVIAYLWLLCSIVLAICALAWGWLYAAPAVICYGLYKLAIGATEE